MKKFLLLIFLFSVVCSFAQTFTAKIIGVKDGDTVVILWENKPQTVRLAHVDCPEKNQPFGAKAKIFVSDFCFGKKVQVVVAGKPNRNGRWIAEIFYNNKNLNKELVRNGLAWHFKKYSKNQNYAQLEREARKNNIGLWQQESPVEPWNWRNYQRSKNLKLKKVS